MPDFQQGKIYTIRSHQSNDFYIGSTTQPLYKRLYEHKREYKRHQNGKCHYVTSFELVKYDDCYIELLEECKCENRQQLHKREGELIRENACVNKYIPGRTRAEYLQDNKEKIKEKGKEYKEANKQRIKEQSKKYNEANIQKIKEQQKKYREANIEKRREYQKQYRESKKLNCK